MIDTALRSRNIAVEEVSADLQRIAVSYFTFVSTLLPAINLSTAIFFIVSHLEILVRNWRYCTLSIEKFQGSIFNIL